jgi:hypothetical protein
MNMSSSASSETSKLHFFKTKTGTELSVFEDYIKTLPDRGEGDKLVFSHVPWQTYMTTLTDAQAEEVAKQPFVALV